MEIEIETRKGIRWNWIAMAFFVGIGLKLFWMGIRPQQTPLLMPVPKTIGAAYSIERTLG